MGVSFSRWKHVNLMSETLAIHTSSHAERYGVFIPRYWEAVKGLNRQPDQIVIVYHESNLTRFPESVPAEYRSRVTVVETSKPHNGGVANMSAEVADTDWVAFCGLDDQLLPEAYDELDSVGGAEILVGNLRMSDGSNFHGVWNPDLLRAQNTLPALSPYRKALWERVGGWPDIYWGDWGFWIKCAVAGVETFQGHNFQALFDMGENHETDSGRLLAHDRKREADEELKAFAREIGFL